MTTTKTMTAVIIATIFCILSGSTALAQRHGGGFGGGRGFGSSDFMAAELGGPPMATASVGAVFTAIDSIIVTLVIALYFSAISGIRSFTIRFTDTIRTAAIPMVTGTILMIRRIYPGAGYTESLTEELQVHLALAGFYHGSIDGVNGSATRRAIRDYERVHGLPANGQITGRLLSAMGLG